MKPDFDFIIEHRNDGTKHYLKFIAKNEANKEKEIEITSDQWDELRYNFMTAVDDKKNVTRLACIKG